MEDIYSEQKAKPHIEKEEKGATEYFLPEILFNELQQKGMKYLDNKKQTKESNSLPDTNSSTVVNGLKHIAEGVIDARVREVHDVNEPKVKISDDRSLNSTERIVVKTLHTAIANGNIEGVQEVLQSLADNPGSADRALGQLRKDMDSQKRLISVNWESGSNDRGEPFVRLSMHLADSNSKSSGGTALTIGSDGKLSASYKDWFDRKPVEVDASKALSQFATRKDTSVAKPTEADDTLQHNKVLVFKLLENINGSVSLLPKEIQVAYHKLPFKTGYNDSHVNFLRKYVGEEIANQMQTVIKVQRALVEQQIQEDKPSHSEGRQPGLIRSIAEQAQTKPLPADSVNSRKPDAPRQVKPFMPYVKEDEENLKPVTPAAPTENTRRGL